MLSEPEKNKRFTQIAKLNAAADADGSITAGRLSQVFSNDTKEVREAIVKASGRYESKETVNGRTVIYWRPKTWPGTDLVTKIHLVPRSLVEADCNKINFNK